MMVVSERSAVCILASNSIDILWRAFAGPELRPSDLCRYLGKPEATLPTYGKWLGFLTTGSPTGVYGQTNSCNPLLKRGHVRVALPDGPLEYFVSSPLRPFGRCCARAATGHAAPLSIKVINSRRLMLSKGFLRG